MGKCSSKKSSPSIDVSGNNNYALLINGAQVNIASIFDEITDYIDKENRRLMITVCLSCTLMTLLLISVLMCIFRPARHRRMQSDIIMRNFEENIILLNERVEKLASLTDHLSIVLFDERTDNNHSDQICVEEYLESLV